MEQQLLAAALHSRASYALVMEYNPTPKRKDADIYSAEFRILMGKVGSYYERDAGANSVDKELMGELIDATVANDKHKHRLKDMLNTAFSLDASIPNIHSLLVQAKRSEIGDRLGMKLLNKDDVTAELAEFNKLSATESLVVDNDRETLRSDTLADALRASLEGESGLTLYPPALGKAIGPRGAQPGSHIVVFGRPEISKSGFCITNAARWAMSGKKVLYFINEDPAINIQLRVVECMTGMNEEQVLSDIDAAVARARTIGFDNVVIKGLTPGTSSEISKWVEQEKPDVIIVDQLRNLWAKADSRTNQLDQVARDVRDIGKAHGIVVLSVSQAGDSAEGKSILTMTDLDSSKCLAEGTEVRMFDGSVKKIEDIQIGEQVMGMDSTPRQVLMTGSGEQEMYHIAQSDGKEYTVNSDHIMVVKKTTGGRWMGWEQGDVADMPLKEMLDSPSRFDHFKGLSVPVEYEHKELPIDPYLLGWWLTDGHRNRPVITTSDKEAVDEITQLCQQAGHGVSVREDKRSDNVCYEINISRGEVLFLDKLRQLRVLGNKHIPNTYMTSSYEQRMWLLAGIIDGDGHLGTGGGGSNYFEIAGSAFHSQIKELCWSLGFKATSIGDRGDRVYMCGDLSVVPTQLPRKQSDFVAKKDVLAAKLTVTPVGDGRYYGITVDGDERYLLANYVVVHNTGVPGACDILIGIGATKEQEGTGYRILTLCKNKANGNHESITVRFNPFLSRYTDV